MIQALGTLKLFKDIDEDSIVEGFEFSQYSSLEEADDKGVFYTKINDNTQEKFINKMMHEVMNSNSCKIILTSYILSLRCILNNK